MSQHIAHAIANLSFHSATARTWALKAVGEALLDDSADLRLCAAHCFQQVIGSDSCMAPICRQLEDAAVYGAASEGSEPQVLNPDL